LTSHYEKFFKNYGKIEAPLITLLKKESFSWTQEETKCFEKLKEAMCTIFVLSTLDFTKTFVVECDASSHGIGVVLMLEGRNLSFKIIQLKGNKINQTHL
jgi:hypothetical protein